MARNAREESALARSAQSVSGPVAFSRPGKPAGPGDARAATDQTTAEVSSEPEARYSPFGENARALTALEWPFASWRNPPVATSHSITEPSSWPAARVLPSGEIAVA